MKLQPPNQDSVRSALERSFLRDVSAPVAGAIVREAVMHRVRAGELFMAQTEDQRCGIVVSGLVRVYVSLLDGRERTLREVVPGGAVGVAAFSGLPNAVNVQGLVDSHVLDIQPELLTALAFTESTLAMALLREVSLRLRDTEALMAAEFGPIRQRLARRIIDAALETPEEPRVARLNHSRLSVQLGCSREWVTKTLAAFRREGLVTVHAGHIRLLDPVRLQAVAHAWSALDGGESQPAEASEM